MRSVRMPCRSSEMTIGMSWPTSRGFSSAGSLPGRVRRRRPSRHAARDRCRRCPSWRRPAIDSSSSPDRRLPTCCRQQAGRSRRVRPCRGPAPAPLFATPRARRPARVSPEMAHHLVAAFDAKILIARRQRIERRDFLHALDDQDAAGWFHHASFRTSMVAVGEITNFRLPPEGTPSGGRLRAW